MARFLSFIVILIVVGSLEAVLPRRVQSVKRSDRWPGNLGLLALNGVMLQLIFSGSAVGLALIAEAKGWGLIPMLQMPSWLANTVAVIALDLVIYAQHVLFHTVPLFWRFHRVHHADLELDVTSGVRFHPVEIFLSMLIKLSAVVILGAPALAVLVFEILLNGTSMFNHGNVRLPRRLDQVLRLITVTPDMHRVHHSVLRWETNSNFGFNVPWWDRLFGTYLAQPQAGHVGMTIGLEEFRDTAELRLDRLLLQPFRTASGVNSGEEPDSKPKL